jgi:hypothetical protein
VIQTRRGNKADHISRCLVKERVHADRAHLRLRQGEPHFSFVQLFFDLVEEVAALEASVAHPKSQGAIEARIIQAEERIAPQSLGNCLSNCYLIS